MTTAAVDHDLASSVLASFGVVRSDLQAASPRVGRVETQAWAAFAWHAHAFTKLLAADLAPEYGEMRATAVAGALTEAINRTAAQALAEAVDIQLARGWVPEVAWQRALVGYGLNSRGMHAHLATALSGDPKTAAAVVPPAARALTERLLVGYAQDVARDGITAAQQLSTEEISKDYDPKEPRDESGRWTRSARSARVAEKPTEKDAVDEVLAGVTEEVPDRYAAARPDRYASATPDRYASATPDRYATAQADRYATARADRYAAAKPDRYANATAKERKQRRRTLIMVMPGVKDEEATEQAMEAEATGHGGFFLPMSDLGVYVSGAAYMNAGENVQGLLNFSVIRDFYNSVEDTNNPIELRHAHDPWDMASGIEIGDADWDDLVDDALELHDEVMEDPVFAASQLSGRELERIGETAGYPLASAEKIKRRIADDFDAHQAGIDFDPSLLDALADHVVWRNADVLGDEGARFSERLSELGLEEELDEDPPEVLAFTGGLADDDDSANMSGQYVARSVLYRSALGTFRTSTPHGVIGMREVIMHPDRV
jgi:hypothetical protein